jgi:hypothetical protein
MMLSNFHAATESMVVDHGRQHTISGRNRVRGTRDIDFGQPELVAGFKLLLVCGGSAVIWAGHIGRIANPGSLVSANNARLDS